MSSLPVLVVEHEALCPPGWVGEWLEDVGCRLDVRRPYRGELLPDRLDHHRGMVVLGGSMGCGADHDHPWLLGVRRLVRSAADRRVPVLGICLGHQLAAAALGGVVEPRRRGQLIGVLPVGWTAAAGDDPLMRAVTSARVALHWNGDLVVEPPRGTEVLAETADGELQAARFAPTVWGVQWHPEVDEDIVAAWAEDDRDRVVERGVDVDRHVGEFAAAREELRASWRPLARAFADIVREAASTW